MRRIEIGETGISGSGYGHVDRTARAGCVMDAPSSCHVAEGVGKSRSLDYPRETGIQPSNANARVAGRNASRSGKGKWNGEAVDY